MDVIKTEKLTKYYGKVRGIENLNLQVQKGDFFGFIGPNGAGKSTAIRTLLGLIVPSSGTAEILGMDIRKNRIPILKRVGYLPSEAIYYSGMKVKEVLKFSAELRGEKFTKEGQNLCSRLQLDLNKKIDELSFGNRKKVGIVCALQHCPELLLLDEPTSGLDPLMQREFFDILKERNRDGATIFLSSHVLSEIQQNCSRAAIIRDGSVIACDSVEALSKTNAKRVHLQGRADLHSLTGVKDVKTEGGSMSFLYSGEMNPLLQVLLDGQVRDLNISEPNLDEIFLHYYEGTKGGAEQ